MAGSSSSTSSVGKITELGENRRKSHPDQARERASTMQTKGRQLWLQLRKGFRHAVEKIMNEEMKVAYLSHGLRRQCHITLCNPVCHITHDCRKKVFVVLDTKNSLHFYKENGSFVRSRRAPGAMTGLLYVAQPDHFVAWDRESLQVLDSTFQVISEVQSEVPIHCAIYSELLKRVVTAGRGNVTIWSFRYSFRSLQFKVTFTDGLGHNNLFSHLALDASGAVPQLGFAVCDVGAASFDISSGTLVSFKTKLHSRVITDLAYCDVVQSPVTASRDTTIKVWDEMWHIRTVFVGHTAPVIALAVYPQRPLIFSASQDGTIRTWNLDTVDQVDQVLLTEPVEALQTLSKAQVISVSGASLTLWKINELYSLYAPLGSPAKRLRCIDLKAVADFPTRVLCVCQDATVRLLDAPTGSVLAVLSLPPPLQVLDAAYCLPRETVFVLTDRGTVLRVNAATDPMVVKKSMVRISGRSWPTCLMLYSHIVDPKRAHAEWTEVVKNKSDRKAWQKLPPRLQDKNRYLVIVGQEDGVLSVVDWFSGRIQFRVEAHRSRSVTALADYPLQTAMVSAGADLTVKMWRVFPYATESLLLLLCFSCATPAWHLCVLGETLGVAFQDPETVTYSIVCYNLMEQKRSVHGPEDDPLDDITGLCCCPNLKLFASASRDGSVRVWDIQNRLLRHLKLDTVPESVAFASPQGDLLIGIDRHLYLIHHNKYLPNYYKMTLLCARFLDPIKDTPLPLSQDCFDRLVEDNVKRLKEELPQEEDWSSLPCAQETTVQLEEKGSAVLDAGSQDLQLLLMGKVQAIKKLRPTKEMRDEAFERYLQIFYKKAPRVEIPEEDVFNADDVLDAIGRCKSISELYGPRPSNMFLGSFPQLGSLKDSHELFKKSSSSSDEALATAPSVPSTLPHPVEDASPHVLPAQKEEEEEARSHSSSLPVSKMERTVREVWRAAVVSWARLEGKMRAPPIQEEMEPPIQEETEPPLQEEIEPPVQEETEPLLPPTTPPPGAPTEALAPLALEARSSSDTSRAPSLVDKFSETLFGRSSMFLKKPQRKLSLISEDDSESPSVSGSLAGSAAVLGHVDVARSQKDSLLSTVFSGYIPNSVVAQQLHISDSSSDERLVRVIGTQEGPESPLQASLTQLPTGEPSGASLSNLSTEGLSRFFLTQLDESQYSETKPRSAEEIPAIFAQFRDADWFNELFPEGPPPGMDQDELLGHILAALPSADFRTKIKLLRAILTLRELLGPRIREKVHNTLIRLLNPRTGSPPSLQEETQARFILSALHVLVILKKDSKDLMVELMTYYLMAPPVARMIIERLIKETGVQDPHNYFSLEMDSWKVEKESPKEQLQKICSHWLDEAMRVLLAQSILTGKTKLHPAGRHQCKEYIKARMRSLKWKESHPMHHVEAINHFVEKQLEQELERLKQGTPQPGKMTKSSVVALPPIQKGQAILRLGETNAMLRKRIPQRFYFPYIFPRYLLKGFVPFVKLPLPKLDLNPFSADTGKVLSPKGFTARQQLVQKYFIPKFSYADSYR